MNIGDFNISRDDLEKLYTLNGRSARATGRAIGTSGNTIAYWLDKYGIDNCVDKKPNGYWGNWENFERELQAEIGKEYRDPDTGEVVKEVGEFPRGGQLGKFGRSDLSRAIVKYHGGFPTIRNKLDVNLLRTSKGYWKNWENFSRELQTEIDREYIDPDTNEVIKQAGEFPLAEQLRKFGRSGLVDAFRYHRGIPVVRKTYGMDNRKPNGYWGNWENFSRELQTEIDREYRDPDTNEVIKQAGEFPEWNQIDVSSLKIAFRYYGGYETVRKKMMPIVGIPSKDQLIDLRYNKHMSIRDIGKHFNASSLEVYEWMKEYDIENYQNGNGKNSEKIRTIEQLIEILDTEPKARYAMQLARGDERSVADILAVVYDGQVPREELVRFLHDPSLGPYLGEYRKPLSSVLDLAEPIEGLLRLDKNGEIAEIVKRSLIDYRREALGAKPDDEKVLKFILELDELNKRLMRDE